MYTDDRTLCCHHGCWRVAEDEPTRFGGILIFLCGKHAKAFAKYRQELAIGDGG